LAHNNPSRSLELLKATSPHELGYQAIFGGVLYPLYVRGDAYLHSRQGVLAAAEFQKMIAHRGLISNEPRGALAHLGLGRARALNGDTAGARAAYQDFFTLWNDADPDIPILKQAKAEYAKLR
jgi:hypothetical protein